MLTPHHLPTSEQDHIQESEWFQKKESSVQMWTAESQAEKDDESVSFKECERGPESVSCVVFIPKLTLALLRFFFNEVFAVLVVLVSSV